MVADARVQRRRLRTKAGYLRLDIEAILEEKAPLINKTIEKYIPRLFSKNAVLFRMIPPSYSYNLEALNRTIADPIWEFLDRGGKRWRPTLFLIVCEALGKDAEEFVDFAVIPEVIHNGTLMIDDIEDASEYRRGKPCTHRIYGLDIAINAGNAMYYLPLLSLLENRKKLNAQTAERIFEVYTREMINLSLGQAIDIAWHKGLAEADEIEEKDYLQMCAYKTGTLARMSAKIASVLSGADDALVEKLGGYAESVGVVFQIQDDVLDLTSDEFAKKKGGRGQDITEGKRSLPVIHTLRIAGAEDRRRLTEILGLHTSNQKLRNEAIMIMQKYGSTEYAKKKAKTLVKKCWDQVESSLPDSKGKEKLKAFAEFLIERKI
jgi:geranylgeranyl diphosphate synthase type I